MSLRTTTASPVTAVAERGDKFTYELNPKSGADLWLKSPVDSRSRPIFPDLHLNVDWAEELVCTLMVAIEEVKIQSQA